MAGQLTIDTLKASSGVLATQNGMTGIAKAWINYNSITQTITSSFNVSSVTYTATGIQTINLTTAMPDNKYCLSMGAGYIGGTHYPFTWNNTNYAANTTTAFQVQVADSATNGQTSTAVYAVVFSS